jgi:hypothetical protein
MSDDRFKDPPPATHARCSYYVEGDEIVEFLAWYEERFGTKPKRAPDVAPMTKALEPIRIERDDSEES